MDHDDPFYQVDNLPVYKLYCRTFEYSSEVLDTGIYAIDDIETKKSTDFLGYEILAEQSVTYNEKLVLNGVQYMNWHQVQLWIFYLKMIHSYLVKTKTGFASQSYLEDSDAYYTFVVIQEAYSLATQDTQSENEWFEDRVTGKIGDPVLDFTESNPFGDPTESV